MNCPPFRSIPELVLQKWDYDIDGEIFDPSCNGEWTKGSGGHRIHGVGCEENATWWHPDDCHSYCDTHCPEADKGSYRKLWKRTFLEGYPFPKKVE